MSLRLRLLGLAAIGAIASAANAGEYLVKYRNVGMLSALQSRSVANVKVLDTNDVAQLAKIDVNDKDKARTLAKLLKNPGVEYVVPNFKLHSFSAPFTEAKLREQWAMAKVNAPQAWARAGNRGDRNKVVVAVIDTGVDYNHESLKPNMVPGFDFIKNNADPMDIVGGAMGNPGHGTHCAGIIGATGLVEGGIIGITPEISIMPLRFLDEKGSGDLNNGIKAIDYAIAKGAKVISASWGAAVPESQALPLIEAVKRANDAGVIFVVAASNDGKNNDTFSVYPANAVFENTITVAASASKDEKPSWSNYGRTRVHLAAPGDAILSTLPGQKYDNLSGTSMATPMVAGLVFSFLLAQDPTLTGAQVRALLQTTGAKVAIETACDCRIDAFASVDALLKKTPYLVPAAAAIKKEDSLQFSVTNARMPISYVSSNPTAATIDGVTGSLKAVALGETIVTATDADGKVVNSLPIRVIEPAASGPGGDCPLGDQALCDMACQFMPDLPFCKK